MFHVPAPSTVLYIIISSRSSSLESTYWLARNIHAVFAALNVPGPKTECPGRGWFSATARAAAADSSPHAASIPASFHRSPSRTHAHNPGSDTSASHRSGAIVAAAACTRLVAAVVGSAGWMEAPYSTWNGSVCCTSTAITVALEPSPPICSAGSNGSTSPAATLVYVGASACRSSQKVAAPEGWGHGSWRSGVPERRMRAHMLARADLSGNCKSVDALDWMESIRWLCSSSGDNGIPAVSITVASSPDAKPR
mmetsp:Transcript_35708/g.57416  ORF Transcript_35708/g.57416 Transcript_35708/m.57416 type:complete len:253 (+) Transcript_35708:162-920(+)